MIPGGRSYDFLRLHLKQLAQFRIGELYGAIVDAQYSSANRRRVQYGLETFLAFAQGRLGALAFLEFPGDSVGHIVEGPAHGPQLVRPGKAGSGRMIPLGEAPRGRRDLSQAPGDQNLENEQHEKGNREGLDGVSGQNGPRAHPQPMIYPFHARHDIDRAQMNLRLVVVVIDGKLVRYGALILPRTHEKQRLAVLFDFHV